jgi:hypothetical protein
MENEIVIRKSENVIAPIPNAVNLRQVATDLINAGFFRGVQNVPQAIAVIQAGSEMGIPAIQALTNITPIKGVLTLSARLLMALAASRAGVTWKIIESTDKRCELLMSRPGWQDMTVISTIEEARKAGLVKPGGAWETYPQDMLFKTAGTRGCRRIAMDATMGMYSTEEIQDADIVVDSPQEVETKPSSEPTPFPQLADIVSTIEELADMAFSAEDDAAEKGNDPHVEEIIEKIKFKVVESGCDLKQFKEWLFSYQNTLRPVRAYVGKIGKAFRFHLGRPVDIESLLVQIEPAIKKFKKEGAAI